jgi:hypothetical protein
MPRWAVIGWLALQPAAPAAAAPGMPLLFVPEERPRGECSWKARGLDYSACVSPQEIRLRRRGREVTIRYAGSPGPLHAAPERESGIRVSEFRGADPAAWRTGRTAYESIRIPQLYPGIDLVLSGPEGTMKLDYIVAPYADPSQIRIQFPGARRIEVGEHGGLVIETPEGEWREGAPVIYQPGHAAAHVSGRAVVETDGTARFEIGDYDRSQPLVIDPALTFSTVLGGNGASAAEALAVGPGGEIVVAGFTDASNFPSVNAQRTFAGGVDAVILKLAPGGASIQQATFLGGSGDDRAFAAAVDPEGGIYVAGWTTSSNFPVHNAWRSTRSGSRDAFLARIAPGGASLTFSTYLGGSDVERATALAADASGVWVGGETESTDFPVVTPLQSAAGGMQDGFLARFTTAGSVVTSTYLGGSGADTLRALALSAAGELYVAGGTFSTDLAVPSGGWRPSPGGGQDGFVLRLNPLATAVTGGTYIGGSGGEIGDTELVQSIAVAPNGDLLAGGTTPSSNFPLHQPWVAVKRGTSMGFLVRLQPDLAGAAWSSFIGGGNTDRVEGVASDAQDRVYATGRTFSADLPMAAAIQGQYAGGGDSFLIVLNSTGSSQVFGTYLGGQGSDSATGVRIAPNGDAVVAGVSDSQDYPAVQSLQSPADSKPRFFVSVISMAFHVPDPVSVSPSSAAGERQVFEFVIRDGDGGGDVRTVVILFNSSFASSNACYITAEPGPNLLSLASDSGLQWTAATAGSSTVLSNTQCQLASTGSGFTVSGNDLRLTLDLAFAGAFSGAKQIYALATDAQQSSSVWRNLGTYTVSPPVVGAPPAIAAIHPVSSAGLRQVFSVTVTDPQGAQDVKEAQLLIAGSLTLAHVCRVRFVRSPHQVQLASDAGSDWAIATPGSTTVLQNSQCRVHAASSGSSAGGSAAVFWADIEFLPVWAGQRRLWGSALDTASQEAAWTEMAAYVISTSANYPPLITGFSAPPSGGGVFTFETEDPNGAGDLRSLHLLAGEPPAAQSGCLILFEPVRNRLSIHPGTEGAAWPEVTPGQSGTAENARCRLRGEGSATTLQDGKRVYQIQIEFKQEFQGIRSIRAHVLDAAGMLSVPYQLLRRHTIP